MRPLRRAAAGILAWATLLARPRARPAPRSPDPRGRPPRRGLQDRINPPRVAPSGRRQGGATLASRTKLDQGRTRLRNAKPKPGENRVCRVVALVLGLVVAGCGGSVAAPTPAPGTTPSPTACGS